MHHVEKLKTGALRIFVDSEAEPLEVDILLWAVGRHPHTKDLRSAEVGIDHTVSGEVRVDEYQETNVPDVFALGDVAGKALLTPVAIAAGRKLANRLFGGIAYSDDKLDYELIPSVVFSYGSERFCPSTH